MFAVYREKEYEHEVIAYCKTREDAMIICDAFFNEDSTYPIGIWYRDINNMLWDSIK